MKISNEKESRRDAKRLSKDTKVGTMSSSTRIVIPKVESLCDERIRNIRTIAKSTHMVLYNYSKSNLRNFFGSKENVVIFEYFLSLAQRGFSKEGSSDMHSGLLS